ncbi:MAG: rRNA maturation RNase YbeY [Victivallales bacterium]|nr:rRNA maturation RNase YbeY [Victivallales bacterium]
MQIEWMKQRGTPAVHYRKRLQKVLERAQELAGLGTESGVLHIVLTAPATMIRLNESYLNHQGITDVLTFDLRDELLDPDECAAEIYVSPDYAAKACSQFGNSLSRELVLYMVHGMLHLAGEDDLDETSRKSMRAAETRVLNALEQHFSLEGFFL